MVVHHHLLEREARHSGRCRLRSAQRLRAGPHLAAVLPHVDGAVHRLERGVGQEGDLIHRVDFLRRAGEGCGGVAFLPCDHTGLLRRRIEALHNVGSARTGVGPVVPPDGERRESLLRRPHVVGRHGDHVTQVDDLAHARDGHRLGFVQSRDLAAQDRARGDGGNLHSRQPHVDAELGLAVHLVRRVQPLGGRADQGEVLRILERHLVRHRQFGRFFGQRAIRERTAGRPVGHDAPLGPARRGVDVPRLGGGGDEHAPRGRSRAPERLVERAHRRRAAGFLIAE